MTGKAQSVHQAKEMLRLSIPAVTWQDNTGLSNCNVTLTLLYLDELSLTP